MTYIPTGPNAARGLGYTNSDYYSAAWEIVSNDTNGHMNPPIGKVYTVYDEPFTVYGVEPQQFVILHDVDGNALEIPGWRWSPYL
mgnify:CR=1 FL=1